MCFYALLVLIGVVFYTILLNEITLQTITIPNTAVYKTICMAG